MVVSKKKGKNKHASFSMLALLRELSEGEKTRRHADVRLG